MSKDPAVLFYTSDFLSGTMLMTYEEKGQYITLLCLQHQQGHLSEKQLKQITDSETVLSKFVLADDGKYHNIKMHNCSLKRKQYSESRSNNRKAKAENISKTYEKDMLNISKTYVKHMENGNENRNENRNEDINTNEIREIIEDLNLVCSTEFKHTSDKTRKLIKARLNEKYTIEDFKKVHRNKFADWGNNPDMVKFLRPETLYGTKFEGYLNEKQQPKQQEAVKPIKSLRQQLEEEQEERDRKLQAEYDAKQKAGAL
jgi:uncharacterized phage protein (TIGR02220 family)